MKEKLINYSQGTLQSFFHKDPDSARLIFSDPRGGSTFLMEAVLKMGKLFSVWEPFHPEYGIMEKDWRFVHRQYIPENESHTELLNRLRSVLSGDSWTAWTMKFNTWSTSLGKNDVLMKTVRANGLLPWMVAHFDFKYKPIHLMRHPVPTALSGLKAFPGFEPLKALLEKDYPFKSQYEPHFNFLRSLSKSLEQRVALWCIHNEAALKSNLSDRWKTVFYEDLILDPVNELRRIGSEWELDVERIDELNIRKGSKTDFKGDFKKDPQLQLSKWQEKISSEDLSSIQRVLDYFDLRIYSVHKALPLKHEKA